MTIRIKNEGNSGRKREERTQNESRDERNAKLLIPHEREESFRERANAARDVVELREMYEEFLARKDAEIERLRNENAILLRTAIKRRLDEAKNDSQHAQASEKRDGKDQLKDRLDRVRII